MPVPIFLGAAGIDLSQRFAYSTTVVASPALAAETIIATVNLQAILGNLTVTQGAWVCGWAAYTVGTTGSAVTLRIRQTGVAGTLVASSGALSKTAASLYADDVNGLDTAPPAGGVYELTMQVTAGAAISTVSAVFLGVILV